MCPKKLLMLSMLAYREGQFENAATFYASAMSSDSEDSLLALLESDDQNDLESVSANADGLEDVVDVIEKQFRVESSFIDDGDEVIETLATSDAEEEFEESDDVMAITASVGPIKIAS